MFNTVTKGRIEELIEEKLNQEFPSEKETRHDEDSDSDGEMLSEMDITDDDSEPNNESVNNYWDSANMATNLEAEMKLPEKDDLWIGESGASSHLMGSEKHVFNKKMISGTVRMANGAPMKMLCEGGLNLDITKNGDIASGPLRVKVITGMMQSVLASHKQCWVIGPCKVAKPNKESSS